MAERSVPILDALQATEVRVLPYWSSVLVLRVPEIRFSLGCWVSCFKVEALGFQFRAEVSDCG